MRWKAHGRLGGYLVKLHEMTDGEIRRELAATDEASERYDALMGELEERAILRHAHRTAMHERRHPETWHSVTDISEGS